ncbi:MAG: thermonuclease family protein [Nitrospirae bacterium]|nr:thermonuclease family protein [Nitrospirota bacterium]
MTLQTHCKDKYERILADVLLPDGTNVNHELVREGGCWWYRKYARGDRMLEGLENVPVPDGFDGLVEVRW